MILLIEARWHTELGKVFVNKTIITFISASNGLVPVWHQAFTWTNAGPLGTNFNEISNKIQTFSVKKKKSI